MLEGVNSREVNPQEKRSRGTLRPTRHHFSNKDILDTAPVPTSDENRRRGDLHMNCQKHRAEESDGQERRENGAPKETTGNMRTLPYARGAPGKPLGLWNLDKTKASGRGGITQEKPIPTFPEGPLKKALAGQSESDKMGMIAVRICQGRKPGAPRVPRL